MHALNGNTTPATHGYRGPDTPRVDSSDVAHDLLSRGHAAVVVHSRPESSSTGAAAPLHEDWANEELKVHERVQEQMMLRLKPTMHAAVGSQKQMRGEYPCAYTSYVGFVVAQDQHNFDYFILNCRVPTCATTLVTKIEHLLAYEEVKRNIKPYAACTFGRFEHMSASVMPSENRQGHLHFIAQFPKGIPLADSNTVLALHANCEDHVTRTVCVRGRDVYAAFRAQCAERLRAMHLLRSFVAEAHNPEVMCKFNPYPGHKIYLYQDQLTGSPCAKLILYVVHRKATRQGAKHGKARGAEPKSVLCILAIDACLDMREELMHAAATDECAICMEPIQLAAACWRCDQCGNRVHHPCMEKWKSCGSTCPFCRGTLHD